MAKSPEKMFLCSECGNETPLWSGKCPSCGAWNSLKELDRIISKSSKAGSRTATKIDMRSAKDLIVTENQFVRITSGVDGLDYVLGGGFVNGEVVLIAGEPGVGKSTLLLESCLKMAVSGKKVIYFSGEESEIQLVDRLKRISNDQNAYERIFLVYTTDIGEIISTIEREQPDFVVIDSIQTVSSTEISSVAGSVTQIRGCTVLLNEVFKRLNVIGVIVGQITKGGLIAGPKVLEHIVDCVLKFEGERMSDLRTLRSTKNRFGSTDEVSFFSLHENGIKEVTDPAEYFVSKSEGTTGVARTVLIQGHRPIVIEVQALLNRSAFGYPKRVSEGYSKNRLELLVAILEKRLKLPMSDHDVYVKVLGGISVKDPAIDLAIAAAILSVYKDTPLKKGLVLFGEVSLSGLVLGASRAEQRSKEALKSGSSLVLTASDSKKGSKQLQIRNINEIVKLVF